MHRRAKVRTRGRAHTFVGRLIDRLIPMATNTKTTKKPKGTMQRKSLGQRYRDWALRRLDAISGNGLKVGLATAAVVLLVLFFVGITILTPHTPGRQIVFSDATTLIKTPGAVQQATLYDQDARLALITTTGERVWTAYPHDDAYTSQLIGLLSTHNVTTAVDPQTGKVPLRLVVQFLLPILILVTLFGLITLIARESGGAIAAFSKWTGRKQKAGSGRFSFNDVAGAPEALVELREFVESLVGVGAARVRDLFRQAREAAPAIIFIDELDAVGRQRGAGMGQGHDEREQTLNQMLVEMDGFGAESGVVVMAATNRPDILDNALLRPGRFDRQVVVDLPDVHGRTEILGLHASKVPVARTANLSSIAHQTPGFSGADLANVINEASLLAVRAGKVEIEQPELEEAIDRVLMGPARKSHLLSTDELWRISVHESGHAIVARAIDFPTALQKLSVVARGRGRGGATIYASSDQLLLTELDLIKQLVTSMGGAAAEAYVFGMLSTGVEDDIDRATKIAHSMCAAYGMSPAIGPVAIGEKQGQVFIGRDLANMGNVAPAALELVDSEVRRFVHEAEETAKRVLMSNKAVLEDLANSLMHAETLSGPSLEVYMEAVKPWSEPLIKDGDGHAPPISVRQDGSDEYDDESEDATWEDGPER